MVLVARQPPKVTLGEIQRADGSTEYTCNGYTVVGVINGPIEVQRRDELPEEAAIDVIVRPITGVGGVLERHLESILHSTLRHIIITSAHPRTQIQIMLQVTKSSKSDAIRRSSQPALDLAILPVLLQASLFALLSASIPLSMILSTACVAVGREGAIIAEPTFQDIQQAKSVHVLAFSSHGDLLLVESEGDFNIHEWEQVHDIASLACRGLVDRSSGNEDVKMDNEELHSVESRIRDVLQHKMEEEQRWKESLG